MAKTGYFGRYFGDRYFAPRYEAPANYRTYGYFGTYYSDRFFGPRYYPPRNPNALGPPVILRPPFIPNLYIAIPQWYNFHYQVLAETSYGTPSVLLVTPDVVVPPGPFGITPMSLERLRIKVPRDMILRDDEEIVTFLAALLQSRILH